MQTVKLKDLANKRWTFGAF